MSVNLRSKGSRSTWALDQVLITGSAPRLLVVIGFAALLYASGPALAQVAPPLGVTEQFSVLGNSGVTGSTGAGTVVNGDVGSSPTSTITNFPVSSVLSPFTLHMTNDTVVQQAHADAITAYNHLAAQGPGTVLAAQLNGVVLTSGIYSFTGGTADLATTGTLTLNGPGVFIFQVNSTLTANVGSNVTGSATACNVFWRVGTSATLNGATFLGNVIAAASITLGDGASLNGRALAGTGPTGAVTMAGTGSNTIGGCALSSRPKFFRRGDVDGSGAIDLSDPINNLAYQFLGTFEPPCKDALDDNDSGMIDISDPIFSLTKQFLGGRFWPAPYPGCGADPTADKDDLGNPADLGCESSPACTGSPDTTRPIVGVTVPANAATAVAVNQAITAAFSEAMDPLTINTETFTLKQGTTAVAGAVSYAGVIATFTAASDLAPLSTYTATVTSGAGDLAGNALATDFGWSFTTGATPDTTPPTVSSTVPADGATSVPVNQTINATFSEAMDPLTINTASLSVTGPTAVTGIVGYDVPSRIVTLTLDTDLAPNAVYTATVTTGVSDLAGNALAANFVWSFTTAATSSGQAPVDLGAAATFAVLAGSTVTSTGATTLNGDLGLSPGTAVTGFPPGTVNGTIHAADPAAAQAQLALTTAYNDAAGRTVDAITVAGDLGGQTLAPGLYKSTSTLAISSGDLTLDAQGDANAVFIFQMGSTLTTTADRQVILSGGAKAANVFWQVGSSATLGTGSVFKGSILALASITATAGAVVEGRLLARTAAVSLGANIIGLAIPADTTAPTVSATVPANEATGVAISGNVAATFSEAMDPLTITTATFTLKQGTTAVPGTVIYAGVTATFAPASALAPLTTFTATVATGARDLAGNALATGFSWSFTTGATPDTTRPIVSATVPADAATAVEVNQTITAAFSEAMNPTTITTVTFTLKQGITAVAGTVSYAGVTATFTPASALASLATYTATVTTGATDLAGNALATDFGWSFTTGATLDTTPPTVSSTVPADEATAVPINQTINATFSEAMDPLTINTASLKVTGSGGTAVTGTVGYDVPSRIATLTPASDLAPNTVYTATMTTGVSDLAGNALAANSVWSFTTAATSAGQAPVALGAAATFAVLAGSTITSTGATMINGDLGLSPGTAVTGFPPGTVNGTIHVADPAAAQAQLDLTTAFNDAAGRTVGAITVAGDLGGQTLAPGLYKSTSTLAISSGDLTLDAQGDANAVFIFQMGSTLTTTVDRKVILSGGAKAANVFWQVGSSATLGTGSVFKGNILALASITVTAGAAVEGRLLARTAAVSLASNIVK